MAAPNEAQPAQPQATIPFEEFAKLDIRTALVVAVENHPKADKLYVLTVKLGEGGGDDAEAETRTLVAGIKPFREPDQLLGKTIVVITNLEPAKIRGIESQGMLLAAGGRKDQPFALLTVDEAVPPGTAVS